MTPSDETGESTSDREPPTEDQPTGAPERTITLALPPWALALLVGVIVVLVARHRRRRGAETS